MSGRMHVPRGSVRAAGARGIAVVLLLGVTSCQRCDRGATSVEDAAPIDAAGEAAVAIAPSAAASDGEAPDRTPSDAAAADVPSDAGASACRLVYGPAEQSFRGPANLLATPQAIELLTNDSGKPRIFQVPLPAIPAKGATVPPRPTSFVGMRWPACEPAGDFVYCTGPGGTIVRSKIDGKGAQEIAKARSGTRIAAAPLGSNHSVVAFLDQKHTSEGMMLQAFVALDDREPVRLSDDGAGATTLRFLPRGDTPVALYLDTRTAMVPVHARPLSLRGDALALGDDLVVFVGGAPERGIDFAAAVVGGRGFAFVPMPRDTLDFGMVSLRIDDPPKENIDAVWSRYPNGIDPAPIAAAPARDGKGAWIARVMPREKSPGSPRVIELGRVDGAGAFSSFGEIAPGKGVTDMSLVEDQVGSVWILYGDTTITWLERRICR